MNMKFIFIGEELSKVSLVDFKYGFLSHSASVCCVESVIYLNFFFYQLNQ